MIVLTKEEKKILGQSLLFNLFSSFIFWVVYWILFFYLSLFLSMKVIGRKKLKSLRKQGAILLSNHSFYLDPGIVAVAIYPKRTMYTTIERNMNLPFVGWLIRNLGAFSISGVNGNRLRITKELLNQDRWIHFFPESVLTHKNKIMKPFKKGAFFLAVETNVPIVPITIIKVPRQFLGITLTSVLHVVVGDPFFPSDLSCSDAKVKINELKEKSYAQMQKTLDTYLTFEKNAVS